MFMTRNVLTQHLRKRFHVFAPGVPPFNGLLLNIGKENLEFADCRYGTTPAPGNIFVERSPSLYLQSVVDAAG